jgi:hypothetical protein
VRRSDRGVKTLIIEAVQKALDDVKIIPQEVDGIHYQFSATISGSGGLAMGDFATTILRRDYG